MRRMENFRTLTYERCHHAKLPEPEGLALITTGGGFSSDQGIAPALCDALPEGVLNGVCRFDLGSHVGFMADCLANHKAAIIIDSTMNGTAPGTVSIHDLAAGLKRTTPINIASQNGHSIAEELHLAKTSGKLPARTILFGVEAIGSTELSIALQKSIPNLVENLSLLVSKVLEALKRNSC
jgi:hydrogenase maturation protease